MSGYLFTSERLGFRRWTEPDIPLLAAINSDEEVMAFFPQIKNMSETVSFVHRMNLQLSSRGYCYFAIDKLEDGHFIGFTGLSYQDYYAPFTPCIDIGWRLSKNEWGKGYATEAAKRVIKHGFQDLGIESIVSIAPVINTRSIRVMQNAGMQKTSEFIHPKLITDDRLKRCVLYQITIDMLK